MKAVIAHGFGPIESLVVEELLDPVVGPGQVLIDVAAAGVNYPDLLVVGGKYQILPQPPFIPARRRQVSCSRLVLALTPALSAIA